MILESDFEISCKAAVYLQALNILIVFSFCRYNISHLEQWFRDLRMEYSEVIETLKPIVQASQLLQARKTDEDVQSVVDMCDKLTSAQVWKFHKGTLTLTMGATFPSC